SHYREALDLFQGLGDRAGALFVLERLARLAAARGECSAAGRILGAAHAPRGTAGALLPPMDHKGYYDELFPSLRASVGEESFAQEWAAGEALTLDEAIALALGTLDGLREQ